MAGVTRVRVDDEGILLSTRDDVVLDVLFDGRRIWSFWPHRDGESSGDGWFVRWPHALQRFLHGSTRLALVEHVSGTVVHEAEVRLGDAPDDTRISVVDAEGRPLGLDKSNRLAQTFDTRSEEHVAPLLDAVEEVLDALRRAGVEAFPAYGTLLGAVREGRLIGHDSDADLGYVSEHTHPVDVVRESFRLQRRLAAMGYRITRYSGAAFKVDVEEADGSVRGLDVFGGFLMDGRLILMGEIRTPFRREWIHPLGTTTLAGRTLPAPADTDRFLTATYGPSWRVPDPAFKFPTPRSTHRRLNGWFRGTRVGREEWDRVWSRAHREGLPETKPSGLARAAAEAGPVREVVDVGCGRGLDVLWFAGTGVAGTGLDYSARSFEAAAARAAEAAVPVEFHLANLLELRHVLGWGARFAATADAGRVLLARHVADATNATGRAHLWRFARMALAGGGRMHLEFLVDEAAAPRLTGRHLLRPLDPETVAAELAQRGARIGHREEIGSGRRGRTCRMVVTWQA